MTSRTSTRRDKRTNRRSRAEATTTDADTPDRKRQASVVDPTSSSSPASSLASPPPKYGSKIYWDDRYSKQFRQVSQSSASAPSSPETDKDTLPYHSWYFTYDELRPLLLPLLLGEREVSVLSPTRDIPRDDVPDASADAVVTETSRSDPSTSSDESVEEELEVSNEEEEEEADDDAWEEVEEEDDDTDAEVAPPPRVGLAQAGPVSILEIGCGDVPLGAALAAEFQDFYSRDLSMVARIVCTDYSPVVVEMMRQQYPCARGGEGHIAAVPAADTSVAALETKEEKVQDIESAPPRVGSVPLSFEVTDARQLPYPDGSFHLVLEKGVLDAVLSDTVAGVADCVQIVSECARVTSGCLVLISHLNAHTPSGLRWLEEVVLAGLQKNGGAMWDVEVHGNAHVTGEGDDASSRIPSGTPGPAVYILHKKTSPPSTGDGSDQASIAVQFFSYQ